MSVRDVTSAGCQRFTPIFFAVATNGKIKFVRCGKPAQ